MAYLIDTNVISELRKGKRASQSVVAWFDRLDDEDVFLSVLTLGEIRKGSRASGAVTPQRRAPWTAGSSALPMCTGIE